MRYAFVASHRTRYPTRVLCLVLGVSVSGFHDYLRRQSGAAADPDAALRAELRAIHAASKRSYGRHRLVRALRDRNHHIGHKRVARLMAEERIQGKTKGRWRRNASAGSATLAPNLLDRKFAPGAGPTAWVGDITYVATRQGWLHLVMVISVQTRQVLGDSTSDRMTEDLVVKAFANAWALHPQRLGLIFHSDRGGQYWGNVFRRLLQSHGVVQSMSRPGNCWGNAVAESFLPRSRPKRQLILTQAGSRPASPSPPTSTASTIPPGYTRHWAINRPMPTPGSSGLPPEKASWRPFSGSQITPTPDKSS
ncbi:MULTISPECIES: IS3 family transposase [unclassified Stenotrophomonas]|uniref:IS3 family transposase n=1 Tax=unclassified Stenotrophomonas TaxID=196198 RepID=UPI003012EE53